VQALDVRPDIGALTRAVRALEAQTDVKSLEESCRPSTCA